MKKACDFLDKYVGTEYEKDIENDSIVVFDMTLRDYQLFLAFLHAYIW